MVLVPREKGNESRLPRQLFSTRSYTSEEVGAFLTCVISELQLRKTFFCRVLYSRLPFCQILNHCVSVTEAAQEDCGPRETKRSSTTLRATTKNKALACFGPLLVSSAALLQCHCMTPNNSDPIDQQERPTLAHLCNLPPCVSATYSIRPRDYPRQDVGEECQR